MYQYSSPIEAVLDLFFTRIINLFSNLQYDGIYLIYILVGYAVIRITYNQFFWSSTNR